MRKTLLILVTLLVAISLAFGACESEPTAAPLTPSTPATEEAPVTTPAPTPAPEPESASTPALILEEIELKYDDGVARDSICTVSPSFGGHIVDFSPPATPFTIKKIRIAGVLSPSVTGLEGKTFDLQILDKNLKVLHSATYPYTKFTVGTATWIELEVPNVEVADKFYIHIYTDSPYPGLHIGADDSVVNQHSDVTLRTAEGVVTPLAQWPYGGFWAEDRSKVNWMIRVIGTYMAPPEPEPSPPPPSEPEPEPTPEPVSEGIELKYDDGGDEGSCSVGGKGFWVHFSPPTTPFLVNEVELFTSLRGSGYENQTTWFEIRDYDLKVIYSWDKPAITYSPKPDWETMETPEIAVNNDFYVVFYPCSKREGGVYLHYDLSQTNNNSEIVEYGGKITDWIFSMPKDRTNWMIRVVGVPTDEVVPVPPRPFQIIEGTPEFQATVNSLDNPEKLSQWMIENITGESYYEREKESGARYTAPPDETFETRSGNCRVFAVFACYILQYQGYEAEILSIKVASDESMNHAVCVYRSDGSLYVINSGRIEGPYQNYEDIASAHHEGWSSYEIHYSWDKYQKMGPPDKVVYRN